MTEKRGAQGAPYRLAGWRMAALAIRDARIAFSGVIRARPCS
jgi:hypothetical protein